MEVDLKVIETYDTTLLDLERTILKLANSHDPVSYALLQSVYGIGKICALTILYEIEDIRRFPTVQDFVSYARLVKCAHESNGKKYGTGGSKIGNAHLKWAFSEAAALFLRGNEPAKNGSNVLPESTAKARHCPFLPISWEEQCILCSRTRRHSICKSSCDNRREADQPDA